MGFQIFAGTKTIISVAFFKKLFEIFGVNGVPSGLINGTLVVGYAKPSQAVDDVLDKLGL
jgi:hypothetical protein